jgi:Undecaprenyl-phosphate glucose phosphotransferase
MSGDLADSKPLWSGRLHSTLVKMAAIEFLVVALAAYIASLLYHRIILLHWPAAETYLPAALLIGALVLLIAVGFQHFSTIQTTPVHLFLWSGVEAVAFAFSFFLSIMFLLKISEDYSRGAFLFQIVSVSSAVLGIRATLHSRLQLAIASGLIEAQRVVLIGEPRQCSHLADRLRSTGILTVGSFLLPLRDHPKRMGNAEAADLRYGKPGELVEHCRRLRADNILILAVQNDLPMVGGLIEALSELPVGVHIVPVELSDWLPAAQIFELGKVLTLQISRPPLSIFDRVVKRAFDIAAATGGLIVASPLFLIIPLAIKLDSRGPIFFRQMRHGYNNEPIRVLKFRTMFTTEEGDNFSQTVRRDPRVTRIGGILRRTSLDELPQLFNVLLGDMSIVGPRPHATAHNEMFEKQIAPFRRRHNVKPGITGWAQVNGYRGQTDTLDKMRRRIECDLYYIDHWSLLLDLKIVIMTLLSKKTYTNAY